jgi:hypothetical protein
MNGAFQVKPPAWFWVVAGLSLLWNLMGCYACYSQLTMPAEAMAALPDAQRDAWTTMPGFAMAAYVVAVLAGLSGALLLLSRRSSARLLFALSLVGVIVQFGWFFGPFGGLAKLGASSVVLPGFIALACVIEIWFVGLAARRGWTR